MVKRVQRKVEPYAPGESPIDEFNKVFTSGIGAALDSDLFKGVAGAYDTVAAGATKYFAKPALPGFLANLAPGYTDFSLLSLLTPETGPDDKESLAFSGGYELRPKMENIGTSRRPNLIPVFDEDANAAGGPIPEMVTRPKSGLIPSLTRASNVPGFLGNVFFGDARTAGEKMNAGVPFEDLSPEEKLGVRFFLLDLVPLPGFAKAGQQAGKQAVKQGIKQLDKPTGSVGAANTVEEMIQQTRNTLGPVSREELQYLSNVFVNALPEQRLTIKSILTNDEFESLLDFSKAKLNVGSGVGDRKMAIVQQDGVPGIMYGRTKDKKRFIPLENLNLRMRSEGQSGAGGFDFTLKPGEKITTRTKAQKEGLLGGQKVLRDIEAAENAIIKELYPKLKAQGLKMGLSDNPLPNTIFAIIRDRLGRDRVGNRLLSRKGFREKLKKLGLRDPAGKSDAQTQKDLISDVVKLTKDPDKELGITNPFVRSLPPELEKLESLNKFLTLGVGVEDVTDLAKLTPDNPQLFNLLESYRSEAQNFLNTNPKFKNYFESLGETEPIVLHKAHLDRTISAGDVSQNFQGLDATNVKILGRNVNVVLQPDLEVALLRNIQEKNVDGTKDIINTMKDFFIGTKLNDPRRVGLTKEDYKWLEKNKIIKIPTITVGVGRPYKNTDAVVFGTEQQPNLAEIVAGELSARKYFKMKTNIEAETGGKLVETLKDGGYVGDMKPVKANIGGFFKKLFTDPPAFRKEGMDVTDLTGPTKAQTQTLESLYPNTAFPEYVPGEVFFSNFDLALSKRDAPLVFNTNKEFRDYMNQSGVGLDELDDAKVLSFANSKFKEGQPVLAQDLLSIAAQSPVRNIFVDGYGFRSEKINAAPKNILDYTGNIVTKQGEPVFKNVSYANTGLLPGAQDNTYRERVMRLSKEDLRGDPGSVPGGGAAHNFGDNADNSGNYVMAWTRQTDRQGNIVPGQTVDRQTGEIVTPSQIADQSKLNQIEGKINKLFEDPITSLRIIDGSIDGRDMTKLVGIIDDLLAKGTIKSDPNKTAKQKAFDIVLNQALSKQKQLKKLQNEYNVEKARIQSFQPETTKEISTTVIDELQSDVFQNAKRKATELAIRLQVMAEDGIPLSQMRDEELLKYFQNPAELGLENIRPGSVFRPVGKTKEELMAQYNELMSMQQQLTALAQQPAYAITPANVNLYRDTIKGRQIEILDEMSENISNDLVNSLYPDLPMKDRLQYADALSKQAIAEAAYRLFVEKDPNAPKYISFMSGEVVAGDAYSQSGRASTSIAERQKDKQDRIDAFKSEIRSGNPNAKIQQSGLPGVGTDEFYGGPLSKSVEGGHYTSTMESIFKKIAQQYGSKLEIINVAASKPTKIESYDIINQNTGQVVGSGDTYRQAENIANDLVDSEGGRYTIDRKPKIQYDTRPIFGMELTPQMLQLFKAYK